MAEKNCYNCGTPCDDSNTSKTIYCESWTPEVQEQTGKGYLDKEGVLKALKSWTSNGKELDWLKTRVDQGEFDAKLTDYEHSECYADHQKALAEKDVEIAQLKEYARYASTWANAAVDALKEELHKKQIALADLQDLVNPERRSCLTCENTECDVLIGADQACWTQAQKKEPELMICKNAEKCAYVTCHHAIPHKPNSGCCPECMNPEGISGSICIPYKEPAQTPAPEEGKSPIQHLQDRVLELEQHQGRDRADLMEKIGALARSVGCLLERLNAVDEDFTNTANAVFKQKEQIGELEDKTSRELSQAFAEVSRALSERKQSADVARDVSNAQAHEIIKMQDQINRIEHRLLLAQDRIAEIHPSGCVPPVKSKPKSRLKTDRTKKVTK